MSIHRPIGLVRISGGLGNQLFQYAFARGIRDSAAIRCFLDTSWYELAPTNRAFFLDRFNITIPIADSATLGHAPVEPRSPIIRAIYQTLPMSLRQYRRERRLFSYDPAIVHILQKTVVFDGHWQHPAYAQHIDDSLRRELTLREPLAIHRLPFDPAQSVSLHVRRTDYLTKNIYSLPTLDYYRSALDTIRRRFGNLHAVVFSDDPRWSREHIPFSNCTFIDAGSGLDDCEQCIAMSLCAHNIIANSTFSWWAAWLNRNPEKHIVAPNRWFTDTALDTQMKRGGLIPESWLRI